MAGVVVAVTGALKDALGDKVTKNVTRGVAVLVGAALGYLQLLGATDVVSGAAAGLLAVGAHSVWGNK